MRIRLPRFPSGGWGSICTTEANTIHLFTADEESKIAIIPPNWFDCILGGNLNKIFSTTKKEDLSEKGKRWLRVNIKLWPFLDKTQRTVDGFASARVDTENVTDDDLLQFAHFMDQAFGSGRGIHTFVEHTKAGFEKEAVKRCIQCGATMGEDSTFQDVYEYLTSANKVAMFKRGEHSRVFSEVKNIYPLCLSYCPHLTLSYSMSMQLITELFHFGIIDK